MKKSRRKPKPKPSGPWTERIRTVLRAMGKGPRKCFKSWGLNSESHIEYVMKGGRPSVKLLLRLAELEQAYAREIKALKLGYIITAENGYVHLYNFLPDAPGRSQDLETVGAVGTVDSEGNPRRKSRPAPRVVYFTPPSRRHPASNPGVRSGSSEAEAAGPRRDSGAST